MIIKISYKKIIALIFLAQLSISPVYADYPETVVGVIDLNYICRSDAAKDAANKDIAKILKKK